LAERYPFVNPFAAQDSGFVQVVWEGRGWFADITDQELC